MGCFRWSVLVALASAAPAQQGFAGNAEVIFVDQNAGGANDGSSWMDAYVDLQDALADARQRGASDIWIARGVYRPDRGTGDRTMAFELSDKVALYGGFSGDETLREQRCPDLNPVVLSGDLLGDDQPDSVSDSSCCVWRPGAECDDPACRALVAGEIDPRCADRWRDGCADNARRLCCDLCNPSRCDNAHNVLRARAVTATLDGLTIASGGGASVPLDSGASSRGGGLLCDECDVTVHNCTFCDHQASNGSAVELYQARADFASSLFVRNGILPDYAWAVDARKSDVSFSSCQFLHNNGGGLYAGGTLTISGCTFVGNRQSAIFIDFFAPAPEIRHCDFILNDGGPAIWASRGATLINCRFLGNSILVTVEGAGVMTDGPLIMFNTLFSGNSVGIAQPDGSLVGGLGGAVAARLGVVTAINSTFGQNRAGNVGGVWAGYGGSFTNSILWNNEDFTSSSVESEQLHAFDVEDITGRATIIEGWSGKLPVIDGNGENPRFVDPDGPDRVFGTLDDNFRLDLSSPAVDAGTSSTVGFPDLDGHPRYRCGGVDLGCYESGMGDANCDRSIDGDDWGTFSSCMLGPNLSEYPTGGCNRLDFQVDGDIDLRDAAYFLAAFDPR